MKSKDTQDEGAVLSEILTKCNEHGDHCFIAQENFDPLMYATFMKGDRLILDTSKKTEEGWLFGEAKKKYEKYEIVNSSDHPCGYSIKRSDGYIHPFWVQSPNAFIGFIAFRIFGMLLMTVDITTDIINGLDYIG